MTGRLPSYHPFHCWSMLESCGEQCSPWAHRRGNEAKSVLPSLIRSLRNVRNVDNSAHQSRSSLGYSRLFLTFRHILTFLTFLTFRYFSHFSSLSAPFSERFLLGFRPGLRGFPLLIRRVSERGLFSRFCTISAPSAPFCQKQGPGAGVDERELT